MKTIMLVCASGMSTSLLVKKMQESAVKKEIETDIFAVAATEVDHMLENRDIDAILLGPQVKFMKKQFEEKIEGKDISLDDINMQHYGMMNGEKVLEQAINIIDKK